MMLTAITLTRVSPTLYTFSAQNGDLTATLVKSSDGGRFGQGTWMWTVDVCNAPIDTGAAGFRDARASVIATLESVAPAFTA
jgi:hypothetical protein